MIFVRFGGCVVCGLGGCIAMVPGSDFVGACLWAIGLMLVIAFS